VDICPGIAWAGVDVVGQFMILQGWIFSGYIENEMIFPGRLSSLSREFQVSSKCAPGGMAGIGGAGGIDAGEGRRGDGLSRRVDLSGDRCIDPFRCRSERRGSIDAKFDPAVPAPHDRVGSGDIPMRRIG
jgi:hypothetical protein